MCVRWGDVLVRTEDDTLTDRVTTFVGEHEGDVVVEKVALLLREERELLEEVTGHGVCPDRSSFSSKERRKKGVSPPTDIRTHTGLIVRTNRSTDRTTNFSQEEDGGSDGGDIGVGNGGLGADLGGDGREAATQALEDLRPDDFDS